MLSKSAIKMRHWRKNNRERARQNERNWRKKNLEKARAKNRRWYLRNREAELARNAEYHRNNKEKVNRRVRNRRHGLTQEQFDAKMGAQGNCCAICMKMFEGTPHVDHNHECCSNLKSCDKCRRGLLCDDCNLGLGRFKDSIVVLSNAIEYLKGYNQ